MPQHKSALKSVRKSEGKRLVNRRRKGILKSRVKSVLGAVEANELDKAKEAFVLTASYLDRMAAKGLIHKNNAARKKSRLWQKIKSIHVSETK